jgi:hemoglobin
MTTLYTQAGGFDVLLALAHRWHERCLADPLAAHPFEHQLHPRHSERLAAYLAEVLGGPPLYTAGYGDESAVQRFHAGNGIHAELDEACLDAFDLALIDVGITGEAGEGISRYFREATIAQRAYAAGAELVPDDLPMNHA